MVAGSGSEVREPRESAGRRHLALGALGFARVDRVDVDGRPALRATVYELEGVSTFSPGTLRAVWRGTVDVDGHLTPEPVARPAG